MVTVTIRYPSSLRALTGIEEERLTLKGGSTIDNLFEYLCRRYGNSFRDQVFNANGELRQDILLLLNGRSLTKHRELYGNMLAEEDVLTLLSPRGEG